MKVANFRQPGLRSFLMALALLNVGWLAAWMGKDRDADRLEAQLVHGVELLNRIGTERDGFYRILARATEERPFLLGATINGPYLQYDPIDGLYVLVSTTCRACVALLPGLNEYARRGGHVVGISLTDESVALQEFAKEHSVPFQLVANPAGGLLRAAPEGLTPFIFYVQGGSVQHARLGLPDTTFWRLLNSALPREPDVSAPE
jgi:hypothetical protein